MKNKLFASITFISVVSLFGLIFTQAFWIKKANELSKEYFEQRAYNALCGVIKQIEIKNNKIPYIYKDSNHIENILNVLKFHNFDSLFQKQIEYNKITESYEYALILNANNQIILKTANFNRNLSNDKVFKKCLHNIYPSKSFRLEVIFPNSSKSFICGVWNWLILSGIFLIVIVFCFIFIVFSVYRHKKLSEMKSDFINNMTHELKTPISTIALSAEMLMKIDVQKFPDKIKQYAKIIYEENSRMQQQVEQVLRMAQLDKHEYELNIEEVDIHELIQNAIDNLFIDDNRKNAQLHYQFEAIRSNCMVDPIHFSNIIKNLVDNACKYSNGNPIIQIRTKNIDKGLLISVIDNGIGISAENQKYIFDKFFRVPTGNVHNVKGTGIGLYYVKIMTEAHKGTISVKSELNKGSQFDLIIPIN